MKKYGIIKKKHCTDSNINILRNIYYLMKIIRVIYDNKNCPLALQWGNSFSRFYV